MWWSNTEYLISLLIAAILLVVYLRVVVMVKIHAREGNGLMKEYIKRKTQND